MKKNFTLIYILSLSSKLSFKTISTALISVGLLLPYSVNAKQKIEPTSIENLKTEKIIAYFSIDGDLLSERSKTKVVFYRKYLGTSKEGDYLVQDFHKNNQKSTDPFQLKAKDDLTKIDPQSIEGLYIRWYKNGSKFSEEKYVNAELEGLSTIWHENGQKESVGKYVKGKREGLWTQWSEDGQKILETTFITDKQEGLETSWHENGVKASEGKYINDQKEGLWTTWNENGQKEIEGKYIKGERKGLWSIWGEDGKKILEQNYK